MKNINIINLFLLLIIILSIIYYCFNNKYEKFYIDYNKQNQYYDLMRLKKLYYEADSDYTNYNNEYNKYNGTKYQEYAEIMKSGANIAERRKTSYNNAIITSGYTLDNIDERIKTLKDELDIADDGVVDMRYGYKV